MEKCIWRRTPSPLPDADSPKRHRCGHSCMLLVLGLQCTVPTIQKLLLGALWEGIPHDALRLSSRCSAP